MNRASTGHFKGFTLIELLVVIAIIGILSSVVLASLSTARSKGGDAKAMEQMQGMRTAAEIYYGNNNNSYGSVQTTCAGMFADTTSGMAALTAPTNYPGNVGPSCFNSTTAWASNILLSNGTSRFCVDSNGSATTTSTNTIGSADYTC